MENTDLLRFSSHIHHLKTHVVQRVVVPVSLKSKKTQVSVAPKTVVHKYIFKVMMTVFK